MLARRVQTLAGAGGTAAEHGRKPLQRPAWMRATPRMKRAASQPVRLELPRPLRALHSLAHPSASASQFLPPAALRATRRARRRTTSITPAG